MPVRRHAKHAVLLGALCRRCEVLRAAFLSLCYFFCYCCYFDIAISLADCHKACFSSDISSSSSYSLR